MVVIYFLNINKAKIACQNSIRVSRGRSKAPLSSRWYPPEGWSQRTIDRALAKEAAEFERRCAVGEVVSRAELKEREAEAYTAEELRHILACLEREPLQWRALVRLLIDTGIRRGECCGLQWKDVDFAGGTITIRGNLCYTPQKGVYLDTPKNGKTRTIDVDPAVMALLCDLRAYQAAHAISRYVFSQDGSPEPMHPQSPTRYLEKFAQRYGVADLYPHKLRHSFASVAITYGADIASVSEKLGHSDKAVPLRMYTHADQESMKRASNIFRSALKNA